MRRPVRKATKIMLIRHAEKPSPDYTPYGVTQEGVREKESLTPRGWQRAGALASFFSPTNRTFQHSSLAEPRFLFASKPVKRKGSNRPVETITPLAEKLALKINTSFQRSEVEEMLEEVFTCNGVVLICWQREYIPEIASHILGNKKTAPKSWPEDRFDLVWVFDRQPSLGRYGFKQVPHRLLMGDGASLVRNK